MKSLTDRIKIQQETNEILMEDDAYKNLLRMCDLSLILTTYWYNQKRTYYNTISIVLTLSALSVYFGVNWGPMVGVVIAGFLAIYLYKRYQLLSEFTQYTDRLVAIFEYLEDTFEGGEMIKDSRIEDGKIAQDYYHLDILKRREEPEDYIKSLLYNLGEFDETDLEEGGLDEYNIKIVDSV